MSAFDSSAAPQVLYSNHQIHHPAVTFLKAPTSAGEHSFVLLQSRACDGAIGECGVDESDEMEIGGDPEEVAGQVLPCLSLFFSANSCRAAPAGFRGRRQRLPTFRIGSCRRAVLMIGMTGCVTGVTLFYHRRQARQIMYRFTGLITLCLSKLCMQCPILFYDFTASCESLEK
jgi:hypothetical protein